MLRTELRLRALALPFKGDFPGGLSHRAENYFSVLTLRVRPDGLFSFLG